jgi:hypothetical protein
MEKQNQNQQVLNLPDYIEQFYRDKAIQEGRDFMEEIQMALQEHMDMLQQQTHRPVPGQDTAGGTPHSGVDTPSVPY